MRDPAKLPAAFKAFRVIRIEELGAQNHAHWLLAAPVTNEQLGVWWRASPALTVLDFRGDSSFEGAPVAHYFALRTLYAELEGVRVLHSRKRAEALAFAAHLSLRRAKAVVHRPYGWEDTYP